MTDAQDAAFLRNIAQSIADGTFSFHPLSANPAYETLMRVADRLDGAEIAADRTSEAVAAERERCARVAQRMYGPGDQELYRNAGARIATAIRSQKP